MTISAEHAVILAFVALLLASGALWLSAFRRKLAWMYPCADEPSPRIQPWSLLDLALVIVFIVGSLMVAQAWALGGTAIAADTRLADLPSSTRVRLVWSTTAATVFGLSLGLAWIFWRYRLAPARFWGDLRFWKRDLARGATLFLLVVPPVLALQMLLTQLFPSTHPLIEIVLKNPEPQFLLASAVAAVLVAPVVEELEFRVLLQGWLQTAARRDLPPERWLFGASSPVSPGTTLSPPRDMPLEATQIPNSRWPLIISSLFFAAMHWNHGPDPVPLFLLALGLGWIYRRSGRVLPCIVVHFLLNLWTLVLLLIKVYGSNGS